MLADVAKSWVSNLASWTLRTRLILLFSFDTKNKYHSSSLHPLNVKWNFILESANVLGIRNNNAMSLALQAGFGLFVCYIF